MASDPESRSALLLDEARDGVFRWRLEQFLVYCDDSKQELGTVNLLVQRNIPVTFAPRPTTVINDTIQPAVEPRIMKAIPVDLPAKAASSAPKARAASTPHHEKIPIRRHKAD